MGKAGTNSTDTPVDATTGVVATSTTKATAIKPQSAGRQLEAEKQKHKIRREKARSAAAKRGKKRLIYSGPYVPGGMLVPGSIYATIPKHCRRMVDALPELKKLFVDAKQYAEFKASLNVQGSEAHRIYGLVVASIKKGVLKDVGK